MVAGSARTRLLLRNIATAFGGRTINILCAFFAIPLAVHALGQSGYGILAVVISLSTSFSYADFGLGVALVTELASAEAKGDRASAQRAVSQAWFFLFGCGALVTAVGTSLFAFGVVTHLLPVMPAASVTRVWFILLLSTALGIPFALVPRIFFALQMGIAGQAWATANRIAVLVGALLAARYSSEIETFVVVFVLLPSLISGLETLCFFIYIRPDLRPRVNTFSLDRLSARIVTGLNFTALQLLNFAEYGIDTILISQFYDAKTVAQYDLLSRLFGYIIALVGMGMWPLWPAIATAASQHDQPWIVAARRIGYLLVTISSLGIGIVFWFNAETFVRLWTGVQITLPGIEAIKFALVIFVTLNNAISFQQVFLSAFKDMGRQSIVAAIVIVCVLPLKYILLANGILYGAVAAAVIAYFPKLIYFDAIVRRHLKSRA